MSKKVLIADDSPTVRNIAESMLKKHGYDVLLAEDGLKAIQTAKLEKPEIVFLDHSLPGLSGEEVLRELKQSEGLKHIHVVMFLTKEKEVREGEFKSMGVEAFVIKPFNPKEMLDRLEDLLPEKEASRAKGKAEPSLSTNKGRSDGGFDILETSDLMEDFDRSIPDTDKTGVHGFDWFLSELQREIQEEEKPELNRSGKAIPLNKKTQEKSVGIMPMVPSSAPAAEHEPRCDKRFGEDGSSENFVEDLRKELEQLGSEETTSKSPLTEPLSQERSGQWLGDLKEKISERVALEVTKMISPEFLEKIIREEIARLKEHIT